MDHYSLTLSARSLIVDTFLANSSTLLYSWNRGHKLQGVKSQS